MKPKYPISVALEDGTVWTLADETELVCNLEWVDTDREPSVSATDALGRRVQVIVRACEAISIEVLRSEGG